LGYKSRRYIGRRLGGGGILLKLECISNKGSESSLTVGETYNIGMDRNGDNSIHVALNDKGIMNAAYDRNNFEIVVR